MSFQNKTVVITGCNKGIGLETLKFFLILVPILLHVLGPKKNNFLKKLKIFKKIRKIK